MGVEIIILWIIVSFFVGSLAGVLGKKYGVEFPVALVAALVVMANIFAAKIVQFGPFTVPAGVIVFSMTFLLQIFCLRSLGRSMLLRLFGRVSLRIWF